MSQHVTPENILKLGLGFWGSKTLLSAIELGVFTKLAGRAVEGEALRTELGLHPRAARDFFDALVSLGMLERKEGKYTNAAATETFLDAFRRVGIAPFKEALYERSAGSDI